MKKLKNKLGKMIFASFVSLSLIGMPIMVGAVEGEETPTVTPSPSPTVEPTAPPTKKETKLELDKTSVELTVGESITITATVTGEEGIDTGVSWDSNTKDVATVTSGTIKALKAGTATITVKANADNNIIATCNITVKEAKKLSSDTTLKLITVTGGKLSPNFSSSVREYTLELTSGTKPVIKYTKNHEKQGVIISDIDNLSDGSKVKVLVTAEDGTSKPYELIVSKPGTKNLNLKTLKVKGYTLNEAFAPNRTGYTVDIPYEAEDVVIELAAESENVKTEVKGATGLRVGKNEITITVKDNSGDKKIYTITVTRAAKEDEKDKDKEVVTSHKTSTAVSEKENKEYPSHTLKYVLVTIGCLILFAIGGIGIYFYMKTSVKEKKKKPTKTKETSEIKEDDKEVVKDSNAMIEVAPIKKTKEEIFVETKEFNFEEEEMPTQKKESEELNVLEEIEDLFDDE